MLVRLEQRPEASKSMIYVSPLIAVVLTVLTAMVMFALLGVDPVKAIETFFIEPVSSLDGLAELLVKATPLVLIGVGLSLGFQANVWNIGAEGQYIMGAIFGAGVGLAFYPTESVLIFPLMVLAGALGGWIWAVIPAVLKVKFGTNEILVSLMLVYVAEQFLASMALGLLKNPEGFGFPGSRNLQQYPSAHNAELITGSGMHWGVVAAFIAVIFGYILLLPLSYLPLSYLNVIEAFVFLSFAASTFSIVIRVFT